MIFYGERSGLFNIRGYVWGLFTNVCSCSGMSNYKRPSISGARVFFTVNLARREGTLLVDNIDLLREAVTVTKTRRPFKIDAWVVLPNHMHAVWTLPDKDCDYATRIASIKALFVMGLRRTGFSPPMDLPVVCSGKYAGLKPDLRSDKREVGIWQRRFWEHHIRDQRDYDAHIRYCWINPVKHGLCDAPTDWPYSSIHRDERLGRIDPELIGKVQEGLFGE